MTTKKTEAVVLLEDGRKIQWNEAFPKDAPKRGRPPGTTRPHYTRKLEIRCTPEQEQEVRRLAKEVGLDVSKYVRRCLGMGEE
jgi:hypothetical protein